MLEFCTKSFLSKQTIGRQRISIMGIWTSKGGDPEAKKGINEIKDELVKMRKSRNHWQWISFGLAAFSVIIGTLGILAY